MKTKKFKPLSKGEGDPIENWLELNEAIADAVSLVRFIADRRTIDGKTMTLSQIQEEAKSCIAAIDKILRP